MTILNKVSNKTLMPGITAIPDVPDAPTIGSATVSVSTASVPFTAAVTGGAVTTFTATSTPGSITGTSATSPISVTGLTAGTSYTFKVKGTNATATGPESSASNSITATIPSSNLFAQFDASNAGSISLSGSSVTQWNDISGNSKNASQGTSGNRPVLTTNGLNGKNTITFDGVNDFLTMANSTTLTSNFTMYIVYNADFLGSTGGSTFIGSDTNGIAWYIQTNNYRINLDKVNTASMLMGSNILSTSTNSNWYQANLVWDSGASSGTQRWNKGDFGSFNRSPYAPATPLKYIGSYDSTTYFLKGSVAEILIYNTAHDTTTRQGIESYFTSKWGV